MTYTCLQICLLDWTIATICSLYPRAWPLCYTTGSYLLVTSHMALGMLLGLWVAHSLMNQAHIVAIFRTGANTLSASSHMKKKSTRNWGKYHVSSYPSLITNNLWLRLTHQKLIQSNNMLIVMFTNSTTKRQYKDKQSSHNTTIDDTKPVVYLQSEYPHIKYWTRQQWKENENSTKDTSDLLDNKDKMHGGIRSAKGKNIMMLYIEYINDRPINGNMAAQIWEHTRMIWKDLY